ncbi:MAG: tetratricopeptide repeat protein [Candidatus Azobacteroides sp.]|nr:tetratricopeptide repeat protein [Candidatus Azobacteroides sp.]
MKRLHLIIYFLFIISVFALPAEIDDNPLEKGKTEFYKEFQQQDYRKAAHYLEKAVRMDPDNAEAHYFLGYAYSRINSKDGSDIPRENLSLTLKASEQFEIVTRLAPTYTGEMILLDPYTKLTADWGTLAMSYLYSQKPDSAIWAFREGKSRGGFSEYVLSVNRTMLDMCIENAILITSGDIFTIPLWYLQHIENYRKDVAVICISLLDTEWYPDYLLKNGMVAFDISRNEIEQLEPTYEWKDTLITIGDFSWKVTLPYYAPYLLKSDLLFLSLLKKNLFSRDIYLSAGFPKESTLGLIPYLKNLVLLHKLETKIQQNESREYIDLLENSFRMSPLLNKNSQDEVKLMDKLRYYLLLEINTLLENNQVLAAEKYFSLLEKYILQKDYPCQSHFLNEYEKEIENRIKEAKKKKPGKAS